MLVERMKGGSKLSPFSDNIVTLFDASWCKLTMLVSWNSGAPVGLYVLTHRNVAEIHGPQLIASRAAAQPDLIF